MSITESFEDIVDETTEQIKEPERKRTVLEVWWEVLKNVGPARLEGITMESAVRLLSAHDFLQLEDLNNYSVLYYDILEEAAAILDAEIEDDPSVLEAGEEDGVDNRAAYLNMLINWQKMLRARELEWSPTTPLAGPKLAAYIDGASFLVGQQGLGAHLSQIEFEFTEADAELVRQAVFGDGEEK